MEVFDNQKREGMTVSAKGGLTSLTQDTMTDLLTDKVSNEVHVLEC